MILPSCTGEAFSLYLRLRQWNCLSSYHLVCSSLFLTLRKSGLEKADSGPEWKTEADAVEIGFKNMTPELPPPEKTLLKMEVVLKSGLSSGPQNLASVPKSQYCPWQDKWKNKGDSDQRS